MEKMPYQPDLDRAMVSTTTTTATISSDWRTALPVLIGKKVMLRELEVSDAPSLFAMLTRRRSLAFHLAAADHGRGLREVHRVGPRRTRGRPLRVLRRRAARHGVGGRFVPGAPARTGIRDGRVGLCARLGVLGHGPVRGRRPDGGGLRRRDAWRRPARGARLRGERPRQRRASQAGRRPGRRARADRSSRTASSWIRCCGPSWPRSGARPKLVWAPGLVH